MEALTYLSDPRRGRVQGVKFHWPHGMYDDRAACNAQTVLDLTGPIAMERVKPEHRCMKPGCASRWTDR